MLSGAYFDGWKFIPFLLISVVFGGLSGFLGSIYSASMQTKMLFLTTFIGATISIVVNFLLVPVWGAIGASIASIVAYGVVWLARIVDSRKYVILQINLKRDLLCYLIIIFQAILMVYAPSNIGYLGSLIAFILIMVLNKNDLNELAVKLISVLNKKENRKDKYE